MASETEIHAMRRAVELAARGVGTTFPNPVVGCVLLAAPESGAPENGAPESGSPDAPTHRDVVGEGWHERAGGPHAEIVALAAAGERARGATAVVTLEPCAHTGRTGPCADALIAAGVRRVLVGVRDPWPAAAGGIERLRSAGVDVEVGVLGDEAAAVNEPWLSALRRGRPFVTWKVAATLDGRVAAADGTSRWITGEAARHDVHRLRGEVDTMLVGVGTVLADDPHLTVRDAAGVLAARQPLRVVADSHGRTPPGARVRDAAAPTWIATADDIGHGADGHLDLHKLLEALHARQRRHVFLEGGPHLAGAMVRAGLVDRVVAYLAPALLGRGAGALVDAGVTTMSEIHRLELIDVTRVGDDVRLTARPRG